MLLSEMACKTSSNIYVYGIIWKILNLQIFKSAEILLKKFLFENKLYSMIKTLTANAKFRTDALMRNNSFSFIYKNIKYTN